MRAVDRAMGWLTWILQAGGALVLVFMMITIGYDALTRHFFARATSWSMEINSFLMVYLALVTAADTLRRGEQIGIGFLAERCNPALQHLLRVVIAVVGAGFSFTIAWRGWLMARDAFAYGERVSSAFGTPMWIPYGLMPVGFAVLGLQFVLMVFARRKDIVRSDYG
ncbi:TRAP transporter small permease [Paracoccus sp. (in: a-proteobacteria)]|nr:TRAP transporter small permease [Paracoccus sp. (in: a-proteobacteria)]MDB2490454.1 TRAP transporter small permease [Paracoccus sp. (in: a-proteobacteria)]MDB2551041.1 TRAP transporter small permease [Paracoccus sp. (in: a-proteobacteria)]